MSIQVASQWSITRDRLPEVEGALAKIQQHIRLEHPGIRGVRSWRLLMGNGQAVPAFLWMEEYESLSAYEESSAREQTPACDVVWAPIYASLVPGTFTRTLLLDQGRDGWFTR